VNLRYGQLSQNRHFKFSPVDFKNSGKKFKNFGRSVFSWLLDAEIRLGITCFVKKWHGDKGWGDLKKATLPTNTTVISSIQQIAVDFGLF
jgi:hypothetical protein